MNAPQMPESEPSPPASNLPASESSASGPSSMSVEDLSHAFAQLLGQEPPPDAAGAQESAAAGPADDTGGPTSPRGIVEALLFVGMRDNAPLLAEQAAELMRGVSPADVDDLVRELNAMYDANRCPYCIESIGAGYRMTLRREHDNLRQRFYGRLKQVRLSQAAIDCLALVAYRGPITAEEVSQLRGAASGSVLAQLVRRGLLSVERTADKPRQSRYRPTERFLRLFGLESLDELPRSAQLEPQ